jgi:glycosyltransferase involved in cell wall biosynthesis
VPGFAHQLWRLLPRGPRRRAALAVATTLAPRPAPQPLRPATGIIIAASMRQATGLAQAARVLRASISRLDLPVWSVDLDNPVLPPALPPAAPLLIHANPPMLPLALRALPPGVLGQRLVIGYWTWELTKPSPLWRRGAGFVHQAWTLSEFSAGGIAPLGVPVRAVPLPLAMAPPQPSALRRADFGLPEDAVVTLVSLNLASSQARKNPEAAIAAHREAFGERADRILVLKITFPEQFRRDMAALVALADAPNIRILTETLSAPDTHALTRACDIVMSLHRSEGFGLVPAEAMLLGRPVIATGWSGNLEFMDPDSAALVGYRLVPAADPSGMYEAPGAVWAEADIREAAAHLRRLADDPAARVELAARGQAHAVAALGPAKLCAALAEIGLAPAIGRAGPNAVQPRMAGRA